MMTSVNPRDAQVLESAGLGGRTALALDAGGKSPVLLAEVSTKEMIEVWRQARAAVHSTRRWPVLVSDVRSGGPQGWATDFERSNTFSRAWWEQTESDPTDYSPDTLLQRAAELDLDQWPEVTVQGTLSDEQLEENIKWSCSDTRSLCGSAPPIDEVRAAVTNDPDPLSLERYLLKWEMARGCEMDLGHQDWFTPQSEPVALALLPDARPWAAYAYVHTLWDTDHVMLIKAAQRWPERYGAEPVGLWGVATDLLVKRQPSNSDEALRLALEHVLLAPSTIGPAGVRLRWHASALMVLDHWHLYSRP